VFYVVWVLADVSTSIGTHAEVVYLFPDGVDNCLMSHVGRARLTNAIELIDHLTCNVLKITILESCLAIHWDEVLLDPLNSWSRLLSFLSF